MILSFILWTYILRGWWLLEFYIASKKKLVCFINYSIFSWMQCCTSHSMIFSYYPTLLLFYNYPWGHAILLRQLHGLSLICFSEFRIFVRVIELCLPYFRYNIITYIFILLLLEKLQNLWCEAEVHGNQVYKQFSDVFGLKSVLFCGQFPFFPRFEIYIFLRFTFSKGVLEYCFGLFKLLLVTTYIRDWI